MTVTYKARPTTYRGIEMRSRLEAQYAQLMDEHGDDWEYEPRAFAGRGGQYLPDFVVHSPKYGDIYIEIKPTIENAQLVLPRMQVIHESLPNVPLVVRVMGIGSYVRQNSDSRWGFWQEARP